MVSVDISVRILLSNTMRGQAGRKVFVGIFLRPVVWKGRGRRQSRPTGERS